MKKRKSGNGANPGEQPNHNVNGKIQTLFYLVSVYDMRQ